MTDALGLKRERGGLSLSEHLDALRAGDLKEVYAFWSGGEAPELPKRELVRQLADLIGDETAVYRRVRTLTRKVLDVLLRILRRADYRSDLPGLFRRLPGEDQAVLEYHEAEAGLRALARRGFLAEIQDRSFAGNGRVLYAVPQELGDVLVALFREETRTAHGVFSLKGHLAALTTTEREALQGTFPALRAAASADDAAAVLGTEGGPGRLAAVAPPSLAALVEGVLRADGGVLLRSDYASREGAAAFPWDRKGWAKALEQAGAGTVARLSLSDYGIACDDDALVLFAEVAEDVLRREAASVGRDGEPEADEVLRAGGDLVADLGAFLAQVKRNPVRLTREGDVHKAGRRRIEDGFVFRESALASSSDVWTEIRAVADHLGLVTADREGFLAWREEADRWVSLPLDAKIEGIYRLALEQPGPRGRSLHLRELRTVVEDCLREEPERWWPGRSLAVVARMRYLASMDARKIKDRHRDRFFSAYVSGRETLADLLEDLHRSWIRTLYLCGILDVALKGGRIAAVRLSSLGARLFGVAPEGASRNGHVQEARPVLVTPDFEVVVLPEGDVADVVHVLDGYAQRVRTGDVIHFRLTKESVEAAVADGRTLEDLLAFLKDRSRNALPQNVAYSLKEWAAGVAFATLERGVVLRVGRSETLDRVLAVPGLRPLLVRRLSPTEALLREEPSDRKLLADLRAEGVYLRGA